MLRSAGYVVQGAPDYQAIVKTPSASSDKDCDSGGQRVEMRRSRGSRDEDQVPVAFEDAALRLLCGEIAQPARLNAVSGSSARRGPLHEVEPCSRHA